MLSLSLKIEKWFTWLNSCPAPDSTSSTSVLLLNLALILNCRRIKSGRLVRAPATERDKTPRCQPPESGGMRPEGAKTHLQPFPTMQFLWRLSRYMEKTNADFHKNPEVIKGGTRFQT